MNESRYLKFQSSDYGTVIFNGAIYADDGFGTYIETDMRISIFSMYNWVMS
jgi:hypothetical protein